MNFAEDFTEFIESRGFRFERTNNLFYFPDREITIVLQPLNGSPIWAGTIAKEHTAPIYIYEDRWYTKGDILRKRICARLGEFTSIFARKCVIEKISGVECNSFMERYHNYGKARCKYSYALRYKGQTVAAASFSTSRPMPRVINGENIVLNSYEWVRYASLPDTRVVGGMGRLLQAFINDIHPDEVMSYCDKEWSEGEAYIRLGFQRVEEKPPIMFYVNKVTYERISAQKLQRDKVFRDLKVTEDQYVAICNMGSAKFLKYCGPLLPNNIYLCST
ncbi:MAG: hypothetical protein PHD07_05820 [Bacteroidales bacterium]|nr:hypothetical protein [Bacteroidales bacterium]MDD3202040.1 hypothetical protein [Bacteroidales bacterium]